MSLSESVLIERVQIALEGAALAARPVREAGALDHINIDDLLILQRRLADVVDAVEAILQPKSRSIRAGELTAALQEACETLELEIEASSWEVAAPAFLDPLGIESLRDPRLDVQGLLYKAEGFLKEVREESGSDIPFA